MPTFNSNIPQAGDDLDATVVRDQLNALKALIDSLDARVTTLEPPTFTASGFGDARANGALTQDGMWNGYPLYRTPGGAVFFVADMMYYRCAPGGDPMNTMDVAYVNPAPSVVTGPYDVNMGGTPPAGIVG